jgi:hypothetical protein
VQLAEAMASLQLRACGLNTFGKGKMALKGTMLMTHMPKRRCEKDELKEAMSIPQHDHLRRKKDSDDNAPEHLKLLHILLAKVLVWDQGC